MNLLTEIALNWLHNGIAPIPCHYKSKMPRVVWQRYQNELPSEMQLLAWFASEHTNLAVVCGWRNLVVLDFDSFDAYELWLSWYANVPNIEQPNPLFDRTLRVVTGRGVHLYVYVDDMPNSSHVQGVIDIKASGYVVTVPSIHPSGRRYVSNGKQIERVATLRGVVPDEWLQAPPQPYQMTPVVSNDPLRLADSIDTSLIATIKQSVSIQQFIGGKITHDGYMVTRCPFHDDNTPSFWIDTRRQICGCYAGCTPRPLDVINLYAKLNGVSNGDAILSLSRML